MNNRIKPDPKKKRELLITTFGRARLVQTADGSMNLRGGETHDQTTAKEWVSLFMHEGLLRFEGNHSN